jgi:hypothetical protein
MSSIIAISKKLKILKKLCEYRIYDNNIKEITEINTPLIEMLFILNKNFYILN